MIAYIRYIFRKAVLRAKVKKEKVDTAFRMLRASSTTDFAFAITEKTRPNRKCSIIVRGTSRSESRVRTLPDGSFRHRVRTIILGCCLHCSFYHNCRVPSTHCQVYKLFYTMHTLLFPFTFCDIYVKSCTYTSQLWLLIPGTP